MESGATITDCTIEGNTASNGGGLENDEGTMTVMDCVITGNTVDFQGGGVLNDATTSLYGCNISGNITTFYSYEFGLTDGGGVYNFPLFDAVAAHRMHGQRQFDRRPGWWPGERRKSATISSCSITGNSPPTPAEECGSPDTPPRRSWGARSAAIPHPRPMQPVALDLAGL